MEQATQLLESIIKSLVTNKDAVRIESRTDEMGVLLTLSIAKEDMGTVIGKAGQTANAIRLILRVAGLKQSARVNLKILEPQA